MLKLPDFTAQSLNLTAAVLNVSTNEIDCPALSVPRKSARSIREHNKNSKSLGVGVGSEVPPIRCVFQTLTSSWTLGGPDGFF